MVRGILIVGALLLVLVSMNGRTVWTKGPTFNLAAPTIRDAAGWDWVARTCGAIAVLSLSLGWRLRRPAAVVASAAAATAAFVWSAIVTWQYWIDLANGAGQRIGWTMAPAANVRSAALIASAAASVAIVLLVCALRSTLRLDGTSSPATESNTIPEDFGKSVESVTDLAKRRP